GLGPCARQRRALQRALRPGLPLHRLRALLAPGHGRRGRARRTLVVGTARIQGMRPARRAGRKTAELDDGDVTSANLAISPGVTALSSVAAVKAALPARSHLDWLESEAIHILREVAGECANPVLFFSGGKDSIVLLRLAEKAFRPAKFPFPLLHIDTGHNFDEVIAFRDSRA